MSNNLMKKEIMEAIMAGEQALSSLKTAQSKLNSAKNWGLFDMFGGDLFSGLIKHSKLNDASQCIEDAKRHLLKFQRELRDTNIPADMRIEVGGFLCFADFFFDGLVADYLVQTKISKAREQVDDAVFMVEKILSDLRFHYGQL